MKRDAANTVAALLNSCWLVRHYARGGRSSIQQLQRKQAIQALGLRLREALNEAESAEDFESLLAAVVDGLRPREEQPPF